MPIPKSDEVLDSVGAQLRRRREELGLAQVTVAARAKLSAGYYSTIENGKCRPPAKVVLRRLLAALEVDAPQAETIEGHAARERGTTPEDWQLPDEAQELIADIRAYARVVPPRFLKGLRAKIREAVS